VLARSNRCVDGACSVRDPESGRRGCSADSLSSASTARKVRPSRIACSFGCTCPLNCCSCTEHRDRKENSLRITVRSPSDTSSGYRPPWTRLSSRRVGSQRHALSHVERAMRVGKQPPGRFPMERCSMAMSTTCPDCEDPWTTRVCPRRSDAARCSRDRNVTRE